jgi:hypothetical protein
MKRKYTGIMLIAIVSLMLGSCRARFYTPNRNPIPLFRKAGDVFIDASSNILNKYDVTAGCAVANGVGAYVGYAGARISGNLDSVEYSKYKYTGSMLNFGIGYFVNEDITEKLRFEIYGDYGIGNYRNSASGTKSQFFNGNYTRIGIMPNIGYGGDNFNIAYSARLSRLTFSNENFSDSTFWENDIARLHRVNSYTMLEQALQFRAGFEHVKFQAQIGFYTALNAGDDIKDYAIEKYNLSVMVGIVLNANVLFWKK